ncbi:MAG: hypothetical protein CL916_06085 [Deltaproteobacteria bacterium]|nr:hypothetical protein [Deltaproteobacteria bacterium]
MSLSVIILSGSLAQAHGIWGHIHVTGWAMEYTDHPELQELFSDPEMRNTALFGAAFTDSGYFPFNESTSQYSRVYSEYTHWEPFVDDYIQWMKLNDPPPFTSPESKKRVAFLLGTASHGLQDEIFDSLFLHRAQEEDGEGQGSLDPACDGFLAQDGELRFFPSKDIPFDPLLDIYGQLDPNISAEVIQDSVELMVGLYVNEDSGQNTAQSLADLYGENLIWTADNYLNPDIPGSIQSEIIPTAKYMEAIWKRLHEEFLPQDFIIATYPERGRVLNTIDHTSAGSWITAIFGAGMDIYQIETSFRSESGTPISTVHTGTEWGESWTRLIRIQPQESLKENHTYVVHIENVQSSSGYTQEKDGFLIHTKCTPPSSMECLSIGVPDVASRTGIQEEETNANPSGCSHFSNGRLWGGLLLMFGVVTAFSRKEQQR